MIHEFSDRFLNLDNSFCRTFLHLFTEPDEVIDSFINGLSYFAISITVIGVYGFLVKDRLKETMQFGDFSEQQSQIQSSVFDISFQY